MATRITLPGNLDHAIRGALDAGDLSQLLELQRHRYGATCMTIPDPPPPPAPPAPPSPPAPPAPPKPDLGYPENTPIAEMNAEQQAAYWKHQSRKHEDRYKDLGDIEELRKKAAAHDKLAADSQTEHEKALAAARKEAEDAARVDERSKTAGELVKLSVTAAAATKGIKAEDLAKAVEFLDSTKFLNSDGTVDTVKVAEYVATLTPGKANGPDTGGQGRRDSTEESTVSAGREAFAARRGKNK